MKRIIIILILLTLSDFSFAQYCGCGLFYEDESLNNYNSTKISSYNLLPNMIKNSIDILINNKMIFLSNKIKYIDGQRNDLDNYFRSNQKDISCFISEYQILFSFTDSTKEIYDFPLNIGLDKYGQILYMTLPHRPCIDEIQNIISKNTALEYASNYCKMKNYNFDSIFVEFKYDIFSDYIAWGAQVYSKENQTLNSKEIIYILINAAGSGGFISEEKIYEVTY